MEAAAGEQMKKTGGTGPEAVEISGGGVYTE